MQIEVLAEKYMLLDSLLFKISTTPGREMAVLAILETCIDSIITLYLLSLYAGHQCVIKTYLTIKNKLFIPKLIHYLRSYIKDVIYVNLLETKNHLVDSCRLEYI